MNPIRTGIGRASGRMNCFLAASMIAVALAGASSPAHAFQGYQNIITTDPVCEATLLANTTNQFIATVVTNPFIGNTYDIKLLGLNPLYNPPPTNMDYAYGWSNGEAYQQSVDYNTVIGYSNYCSSATYFNLVTIDSATCMAVAGGLSAQIWQLHLSTPTLVSGEFQ